MTRYYIAPARPLGPRGRGRGLAQQQQAAAALPTANEQGAQPQQAAVQEAAVPPSPPPPDEDHMDPLAVLGRPKTLLQLWHEYMFGLHNHKPAKDFTPRERGRCKTKYSRRRSFWMVMSRLIRGGHNELTAIGLIEQCYGRSKPVTYILNCLMKARADGYHPNLSAALGL